MNGLQARLIGQVPSRDGTQAELLLIEPNGDEHPVRCLCKQDGTTDIGGDGEMITFLNAKYGQQTVCSVSRKATLAPLDQEG